MPFLVKSHRIFDFRRKNYSLHLPPRATEKAKGTHTASFSFFAYPVTALHTNNALYNDKRCCGRGKSLQYVYWILHRNAAYAYSQPQKVRSLTRAPRSFRPKPRETRPSKLGKRPKRLNTTLLPLISMAPIMSTLAIAVPRTYNKRMPTRLSMMRKPVSD